MDLLKKLFPVSFAEKKDVGSLIVSVIMQVVAGIITAFVFGLLGRVPLIGILFDLLGALAGLYITGSIVFTFLHFFNVLK